MKTSEPLMIPSNGTYFVCLPSKNEMAYWLQIAADLLCAKVPRHELRNLRRKLCYTGHIFEAQIHMQHSA